MGSVVTKWEVNRSNDANQPLVSIATRTEGIVNFILSLLRIEPTTSLVVSSGSVHFEQGNLFGYTRAQFHPTKISMTVVGFRKNIKPLIVSLLAGSFLGANIGGVWGALTFLLCFAAGALFYYLSKEVSLIFRVDGRDLGLSFKSSVLNGVKVDENNASAVAKLIEELSLRNANVITLSKAS
jgi:hypothetical protein